MQVLAAQLSACGVATCCWHIGAHLQGKGFAHRALCAACGCDYMVPGVAAAYAQKRHPVGIGASKLAVLHPVGQLCSPVVAFAAQQRRACSSGHRWTQATGTRCNPVRCLRASDADHVPRCRGFCARGVLLTRWYAECTKPVLLEDLPGTWEAQKGAGESEEPAALRPDSAADGGTWEGHHAEVACVRVPMFPPG